jgi:hypothetical protein
MLDNLAPADVLTVARLDRLARSTFDLFGGVCDEPLSCNPPVSEIWLSPVSPDSPLEEDGFEPSVPQQICFVLETASPSSRPGRESLNPYPPSGREACANPFPAKARTRRPEPASYNGVASRVGTARPSRSGFVRLAASDPAEWQPDQGRDCPVELTIRVGKSAILGFAP